MTNCVSVCTGYLWWIRSIWLCCTLEGATADNFHHLCYGGKIYSITCRICIKNFLSHNEKSAHHDHFYGFVFSLHFFSPALLKFSKFQWKLTNMRRIHTDFGLYVCAWDLMVVSDLIFGFCVKVKPWQFAYISNIIRFRDLIQRELWIFVFDIGLLIWSPLQGFSSPHSTSKLFVFFWNFSFKFVMWVYMGNVSSKFKFWPWPSTSKLMQAT